LSLYPAANFRDVIRCLLLNIERATGLDETNRHIRQPQ
jgi:hypothetical protein